MFRNNSSTLISPVYAFSLTGNIMVYTPSQSTNTEKYFNHIIYKDKSCRFWRETNTSPSISSLLDCVISIFRRKKYEPNPSEVDIIMVIPAPTQLIIINTKDQTFFRNKKKNNSSDYIE